MGSSSVLGKRKRPDTAHPYLSGNFAPVHQTYPLTPCPYEGDIPPELLGGQYVRNGSNPVSNHDLGREAHWFDGDGMLSGVLFKRCNNTNGETTVQPEFVNQYILTDIFLSSLATPALKKPILPSIATLVNPLASVFRIVLSVLRAIFLVILSRLPRSKQAIKKISVANTSIIYHDGRALATCESGPPLRVALPSLDTVGWFDGNTAQGEPPQLQSGAPFGGNGLLSFIKEWTTAHPKVDPESNEMVLFHSNFIPPYVNYTILQPTQNGAMLASANTQLLRNKPVAGVSSAKMMHDFGVSRRHTIIMDLPLTLDPSLLLKNKPPILYDAEKPARFGVFPRYEPSNVRWFETSACCIFHTANTWDVLNAQEEVVSVDMLACRMTSAAVVFRAGNIPLPRTGDKSGRNEASNKSCESGEHGEFKWGPMMEAGDLERMPLLHNESRCTPTQPSEDEQCRLYYYSFSLDPADKNEILFQFALSAIPFEFPSVRADRHMSPARFVYGCTTTEGTFNSSLGRTARIDALVKFDAQALISKAKAAPPASVTGCVDARSVKEIVASSSAPDRGGADPIQIFQAPSGYLAQEPRFAPSAMDSTEDAGFLLTYMFDEAQLGPDGQPPPSAVSELWIIDAKGMADVLAKVHLPQRVPYGLHGNWFPEQQVLGQRPIAAVRQVEAPRDDKDLGRMGKMGQKMANALIRAIGG